MNSHEVYRLGVLGPDHVQVFWKHKGFGNISQLETRPLIGWPSSSTNQRPGFQLTYSSKTLAHDPALYIPLRLVFFHEINGKRFFRYAIMLYLRKYSVLIMDIVTTYADGPALFILQFEIFAIFFIPASALLWQMFYKEKSNNNAKSFCSQKGFQFYF